jgi:hypothetical protein
MSKLTRRRFLIIGGAGAVAVAAGGAALAIRQFSKTSSSGGTLTFRAVAPLPRPPLVSYASYVITGQVDLGSGTGTITRTVFAGDPGIMLPIALLTRQAHVTSVETQGSTWRITGKVDNPSQLQPGESASFTIVIDPDHHAAQSDFYGDPIQLQLQQLKDTSQ